MMRRHVLSIFGSGGVIGLAGCLTGGSSGGGSLQRQVSLADQDAVAGDHELRINVELLEPSITDTQPARVQITTTNEGPRRALSIGIDGCVLFNRDRGGSDEPPGLWLHTLETAKNIERTENRWVRDAPADQLREYLAYGCRPREYDAGESVTNKYEIWDDYRVDGYLDSGTYRWEEEVSIWHDPSSAEEADTTLTWGFSLTNEHPD